MQAFIVISYVMTELLFKKQFVLVSFDFGSYFSENYVDKKQEIHTLDSLLYPSYSFHTI